MPIKKVDMVIGVLDSGKDFFKKFFQDAFKLEPNLTLERFSEIISPYLDDLIKKHEARGFKYVAGKLSVKCAGQNHFQLNFEMYFQDGEGKWFKCANESEKREKEIWKDDAWKTIRALNVITFPVKRAQDKAAPVEQKKSSDGKETPAFNEAGFNWINVIRKILNSEELLPVKQKKSSDGKEYSTFDELADFLRSAKTWREFEACLKIFLHEVPHALIVEGIVDYSAKIFSCVEFGNLRVSYRLSYKKNGTRIDKTLSSEFNELTAPTWATKDLSATETDVTDRYEKYLQAGIK